MRSKPERTCIGCRCTFPKDEVVRIAAGPEGAVIDYREKLPGRTAYVCPKRDCIEKALRRENLAKALKLRVEAPSPEQFTELLIGNITGKIRSLISISAKAGKLAAGYSAVLDSFEKGRAEMIVYASDVSGGTKDKLDLRVKTGVREAIVLSRDELGGILNREFVGVVAIEDKGLAEAVLRETERLKSLINNHD